MKLVSMLVVIILLCASSSSFINVVEGRLSLFKAGVTIVDLDLNNTANTRTYDATIYYRDDKAINGTTERIRTDIFLASSGQTLTFLEIYEKIWGRYTLCSGGCNYQDIFPDELPKLWVDPADNSRVDKGSYYEYVFDHNDGSDFVTLRTSKTTFEPISADVLLHISSVDGTTRSILKRSITFNTFNQSNGAIPSGALNIPVNCPTINHGCSRLDMIIILDNTGSIGLGWYDELTFATNIINNFFMSPQLVQIGLIKFKTEAYTVYPLTSDKNLLFQALNLQNTSNNGGSGQTSQVSAMAAALDMFENYGRPATSRAVMIISDGVGNRPCAGSPYTNYTGPFCGTLNPLASYFSAGGLLAGCNNDLDGTGTIVGCTNTNLGAQNGACCEAVHRILLQQFYASSRWTEATNNGVPITIYAIAVAGKDSFGDDVLLELADNQAKNVYRVTSFGDLNTLTDKIAVQLVNADCSVPTPSVCPYDCLPGGFCCGSACVCITDCSTLNNDCQVGFCASSDSGTGCTRTTPNDLLCQDGNACVNRTCLAGVGCNTVILTNVVNCTDHNPCTVNDTCTATGQCNGTIDDSQSCTIDVCTYAQCVSGVCTKTGEFKCPDTNPNDCVYFPCTVRNGEITCPSKVAPDGRNCSTGNPTSDPCVVDVCVSGSCERGRIENNSTCPVGSSGDGDGVDAETIGLAVGIPVGVFLLLLCLILILVVLAALLFLTRDSWVPSNGGLLNAFSSARSVKNNPDFHDNIGMTNLAYDRG